MKPCSIKQSLVYVTVALTAVALLSSAARTQEQQPQNQPPGQSPGQPRQEGEMITQTLMFPTGKAETSVLQIDKIAPAKVVVGQPYAYQIRITNLSSAHLTNVLVNEQLPDGFDFDRSDPQPAMGQPRQSGGQQQGRPSTQPAQPRDGQQPRDARQAGDRQPARPDQPQANQAQANQDQADQAKAKQGQAKQGQANQGQTNPPKTGDVDPTRLMFWYLGELAPKQSLVIAVQGYATKVGRLSSCVSVDYTPTLCVAQGTEVVNPEISLTKKGPEQVDICQPITYTYTVRNAGSGVARNVRIEDPLPEQLTVQGGERKVSINVGDLPAGESKDFPVKVLAASAGEFGSRAVARSETDTAHSEKVTTKVIQPDLAVNVEGPAWEYIGERVPYTVTVTNRGEAPARQTTLQIGAENAQLVENPRPANPAGSGEAQLASARTGPGQYNLGDLQPGESRTLKVALRGTTEGDLKFGAKATAVCPLADKDAIVAGDTSTTYIATLAALVLEVVDRTDPVKVGENTIYEVGVKNQGSGEDTNVQITATLPEGMEFVKAHQGATEVKAEGQKLTFGPIEKLSPGQVANWYIEVKATKAADARFKVDLQSKSLKKPVVEMEPTRLYQ